MLFMSKSTGGITVSEGAHARPASSPVRSMSCLARCVIISHPLALSAEITTQHPARSTATTLHKRQCPRPPAFDKQKIRRLADDNNRAIIIEGYLPVVSLTTR